MKTIVVVDKLPYVVSKKGNIEETILNNTNSILNKSQKNKAATTKILKINKGDDQTTLNLQDVPFFMQETFYDHPNCHYVGMLSMYNSEIHSNITKQEGSEILSILKDKGCTPILHCPTDKNLNYFRGRMSNILNAHVWDDIYNCPTSQNDYKNLNKKYSEAILQVYEPGDQIIILSHVAWLVPSILCSEYENVHIGLFITANLPNIELLRSFFDTERIVKSFLCCSSINVQSSHDKTNLIQIMQYYYPVSIKKDVIYFEEERINLKVTPIVSYRKKDKETGLNRFEKLSSCLKGKTILSVADQNNLVAHTNAILACDVFMKNYSGKVALLLCTIVKEDLLDFETMSENQRMICYLKKKHPNLVVLCFEPMNDCEFNYLMRNCDLALFLTERDTFCKEIFEFAAYNSKKKLPFICSKFSHFLQKFTKHENENEQINEIKNQKRVKVARESNTNKNIQSILEEITCEPKNSHKISDLINNFLSEKSKQTFSNVYNEIKRIQEKPQQSIALALQNLEKIKYTKTKTNKTTAEVLEAFKKSTNPAIFLDYDGTLTKIVEIPEEAQPTGDLIEFLNKLSAKNKTVIVTGRSKQIMDEWFKECKIEISAEHGMCYKQNNQWTTKTSKIEAKESAIQIFEYFKERLPGSTLEIKDTSICFHYRRANEKCSHNVVRLLKSALHKIFKKEIIVEGKCNLEMRFGVEDKGDFVEEYLKNANHTYDFVLVAGDDKTDEDMFRWAENHSFAYSIHVGTQKTRAKYRTENVKSMLELLSNMT